MNKNKTIKITKKELNEYNKEVRKRGKGFKLKPIDFHNLYDLFWMTNKDLWENLKLNKMDEWFHNFAYRVERVLFTEDFALEKLKRKFKGKKF